MRHLKRQSELIEGASRLGDRSLGRRVPVRALHVSEPESATADESPPRRAKLRRDRNLDSAACFGRLCVRAQHRAKFFFHWCVNPLIPSDVADVVAAVASDPSARLVRLPMRVRLGLCFLAFHGICRDTQVPGRTPCVLCKALSCVR